MKRELCTNACQKVTIIIIFLHDFSYEHFPLLLYFLYHKIYFITVRVITPEIFNNLVSYSESLKRDWAVVNKNKYLEFAARSIGTWLHLFIIGWYKSAVTGMWLDINLKSKLGVIMS